MDKRRFGRGTQSDDGNRQKTLYYFSSDKPYSARERYHNGVRDVLLQQLRRVEIKGQKNEQRTDYSFNGVIRIRYNPVNRSSTLLPYSVSRR